MESSTTIRRMMANNKIIVPEYQRAYSWDTPSEKSSKNTQIDVFMDDLEEHCRSKVNTPYYFGHFLFEEQEKAFNVIDGQQRLTTIVIFLSAIFCNLRGINKGELSEEEENCYEDMVKRKNTVRLSTVDYDNQIFVDYVINQNRLDINGLETESSLRIVSAFNYFNNRLSEKDKNYLNSMLSAVANAVCTTHSVKNEAEAIQMFIFQNNRGKQPSNLEIIKAQFMHQINLRGENKEEIYELIVQIKKRFEKIYKSISSIEYRIDEDDVLLYTLRVYFNSLWETSSLDKINKILAEENPINFIIDFSMSLSNSFDYLARFFGADERDSFAIHSLVSLGGISITIPFIIKAYDFGLSLEKIGELCRFLESLVLRQRLIGTRADITTRINGMFEGFTSKNSDILPIIKHIKWMETTDEWWWAYWNNEKLKDSLQGEINHSVAKFLLWKYEVYLEGENKPAGYLPTRFDKIKLPELEHIAPKKEPDARPHGYSRYTDSFVESYLDCIGNYLLLSKSHNCAVGNITFERKLETYNCNEQQREIKSLVGDTQRWTTNIIAARKEKIIGVIMDIYSHTNEKNPE